MASPRAFLTFRGAVCALVLVGGATSPRRAHANGRFPSASQIVVSPTNPSFLVLRATFGLLVSTNAGADWDWVCEIAMGYSGEEDPSFGVLERATVIAGTFEGLSISTAGGCAWAMHKGALKGQVIADVDVDRRRPAHAYALSSRIQGADGDTLVFDNRFFATSDNAATWAQIGSNFEPAVRVETLEVAPSDPSRIYVSGVRGAGVHATGALLVSRDRGRTWTERQHPFEPRLERAPFIAAVDPTDADRVYVRTSGAPNGKSRLLVTEDAGATFRTLLTGKGALLGFALSPDGATLFVGGPADGLLAARRGEYAFTTKSTLDVRCLAVAGGILFACSTEASGFLLGASADDGATFRPKLHVHGIRGPLACAPGTVQSTACAPAWQAQASLLAAARAATPPSPPERGGSASDPPGPPPAGSELPVAPAAPADRAPNRLLLALGLVTLAVVSLAAGAVVALRRRGSRRR